MGYEFYCNIKHEAQKKRNWFEDLFQHCGADYKMQKIYIKASSFLIIQIVNQNILIQKSLQYVVCVTDPKAAEYHKTDYQTNGPLYNTLF